MGKPLTPAQEKIRDAQIEKNNLYIEKLGILIEDFEPIIEQTTIYNNYLVSLFEKLEKAHGKVWNGEFANYYTKNLEVPRSPLFHGLDNNLSLDYRFLGNETRKQLTSSLPDEDEYREILDYYSKQIQKLVEEVYTSNSFVLRFEGMDEIHKELTEVYKNIWSYPRKVAYADVVNGKEYYAPLILHGIPKVEPFHIELYVKYASLINTALILKSKLTNTRMVIMSINANLPFAELKDNPPLIQNNVNGVDKSTVIESGVQIGHNNAIGDNAKVGDLENGS